MHKHITNLFLFLNALVLHLYIFACTVFCVWFETLQCANVTTEALYEKKKSIVAYDAEIAKLQVQVEKMESASAEKDAEYEAMVEKSEGEVMW